MSDDAPQAGSGVPAGAISKELLIINKRGLHARASAKFVQAVERFNAQVWVTRGGETVGGTSIMGLMMLAAGPGTTITVAAAGAEVPMPRSRRSRSSLKASSTRKGFSALPPCAQRRRVGKGATRRAHHLSTIATEVVGTLRFAHPTAPSVTSRAARCRCSSSSTGRPCHG
ncbi:phosphotransferase system HPr (HPr) family protein [Bradyrhizobium diazoefficiens]